MYYVFGDFGSSTMRFHTTMILRLTENTKKPAFLMSRVRFFTSHIRFFILEPSEGTADGRK